MPHIQKVTEKSLRAISTDKVNTKFYSLIQNGHNGPLSPSFSPSSQNNWEYKWLSSPTPFHLQVLTVAPYHMSPDQWLITPYKAICDIFHKKYSEPLICHYFFLQNRHPIAHLWGQGMGSLSQVQPMFTFLGCCVACSIVLPTLYTQSILLENAKYNKYWFQITLIRMLTSYTHKSFFTNIFASITAD